MTMCSQYVSRTCSTGISELRDCENGWFSKQSLKTCVSMLHPHHPRELTRSHRDSVFWDFLKLSGLSMGRRTEPLLGCPLFETNVSHIHTPLPHPTSFSHNSGGMPIPSCATSCATYVSSELKHFPQCPLLQSAPPFLKKASERCLW